MSTGQSEPSVIKHAEPVAGVVVGFFPDFPVLDALLASLLEQVDVVAFVDNGGGADYLKDQPGLRQKVVYLDMQGNQGLGAALNRGFEAAMSQGCRFVATFDQDSLPAPGLIAGLMQAHQRLRAQGIRCAAVGPRFYDRRQGRQQLYPAYREEKGVIATNPECDPDTGLLRVDVLITSGMLVDVQAWREQPYLDGLFVDYTDTDWCFRIRAAGYALYAVPEQQMAHALSDAPPIEFFGLNFLRYSPVRRYFYARNTIYFVRQKYVSWPWKKRLLIGLVVRFFSNLVIDERRGASLMATLRGMADGLRGRLGAAR